jgi:hypothetical protein
VRVYTNLQIMDPQRNGGKNRRAAKALISASTYEIIGNYPGFVVPKPELRLQVALGVGLVNQIGTVESC